MRITAKAISVKKYVPLIIFRPITCTRKICYSLKPFLMANVSANILNYFKLDLFIARSGIRLRQLFKSRYSDFNHGQLWDDTAQCGTAYATKLKTNSRKVNLTPLQKNLVLSGDTNEWDLTTLIALLSYTDRPSTMSTTEKQQLDVEDALLQQLRDIRNTLAHHPSKSISDSEFHQLWSTLTRILVILGEDETELEKWKHENLFDKSNQATNVTNVAELLRLNSLGTKAHKEKRFSEAIVLFTRATTLSGVSDRDRALVFSNMSASKLALYEEEGKSAHMSDMFSLTDERYQALHDAKQARSLWPTSWQGHFRVGKANAALNDHDKAISSFERALALDPVNKKIQDALYDSRHIHGQQSRHDHLNPKMQPMTMDELFQDMEQKLGSNPEDIRSGHRLRDQFDPVGADVVRGHKYFHGDIDVEQDYEQAATYFGKAASQGNAEGMYNLALLTDRGLGVKKDHSFAVKLLEQAASQPAEHPTLPGRPNIGVAEAEHSLGLRYYEGVVVSKNPSIAAMWYQRAVDHGSAEAANNLAIMYQTANGVEKNLDRARQLFELSARRGDPNAMKSLADDCLDSNDFDMARIWYDRACEAGNGLAQVHRDEFERKLKLKRQMFAEIPSDTLHSMAKLNDLFETLKMPKTACTVSAHASRYDFEVLGEHAKRGSATAAKMCQALEHFYVAFHILTQSDSLTMEQENRFIQKLAQCYRLEHIVAQIPSVELHRKVGKIIDQVLERCCKNLQEETSELDEDVRVCYAVFHINSHVSTLEFVHACKMKYPKAIFFFELSSALNGWLNNFPRSLYDANCGLEIDPNYTEVLYSKAVALRVIESNDPQQTINAYQAFLSVAPPDHRKVPESFYSIAGCYLQGKEPDRSIHMAKQMYEKGQAAEEIQLPCFLPYKSNTKILLTPIFEASLVSDAIATPTPERRSRLTDPTRIEIIKSHRRWISQLPQMAILHTRPPRLKQPAAKSLIGLKSISLRDMNPIKDHVYTGHVLSVTIIEGTRSWAPSIHLVVEDDNFNCEFMCIYGFPEAHGKHLVGEVFTLGTKMSVINPYHRIGANDMKPMIRIDEFSSIIMANESERVVDMCRCCHQPNAPHICRRCQQARYCSKECQTLDWKLYEHKWMCRT